jgi:hypothetical protein
MPSRRLTPDETDQRLKAMIIGTFSYKGACKYLATQNVTITIAAYASWLTGVAQRAGLDPTQLVLRYATRMRPAERYALFSLATQKMGAIQGVTLRCDRDAYSLVRGLVGPRLSERRVQVLQKEADLSETALTHSFTSIGTLIDVPGKHRWLRFLCVLDLYARANPKMLVPPEGEETPPSA